MRLFFAVAAALLLASAAHAQSPPASATFDPSTPIESRIGGPLPETTLRSYTDTGRTAPTAYTPTEAEKRKVAAALAALSPLQRSFAQDKLRSITFATGLQSNAQTTRSRFGGGDTDFDIVLNAMILKESVSGFLTRKENQLFDTTGSKLSVTIDGGSMDAVAYILLHEVTHMVDMSQKLTPQAYYPDAIPDDAQTPFTRGVWAGVFKLATPYHDAIFERVNFAPSAKTIPVAEARSLYEALGKTPLVSIYASRGKSEDMAETAAWRQMEKLGQPYRIEIRDMSKDGSGKIIYTYEPLRNPLFRARLAQFSMFDTLAAK